MKSNKFSKIISGMIYGLLALIVSACNPVAETPTHNFPIQES
jgi:hypothetical protein